MYLNKIYNKYVNLVENSTILNQMNKNDNLVIDPKLLNLDDGSSLSSNGSNPIIREEHEL